RSGRHLAHRRRRPNLEIAKQRRDLPPGSDSVSERGKRLRGRRLDAAVHARNARRGAPPARWWKNLARLARADIAGAQASSLFRCPPGLGAGRRLASLSGGRVSLRRWRKNLVARSQRRNARLGDWRFSRYEERRGGWFWRNAGADHRQ